MWIMTGRPAFSASRVHVAEPLEAVAVGVGGEDLVRRMDLEHPDAERLEEAPRLGARVGARGAGARTRRREAVLVAAHVAGDPVVGRPRRSP